ncbi:MAG: DUF4407 domain-containing protein [Blastococcus sp.]
MSMRTVLTRVRSAVGRRTIRNQLLTIAGANRSVLRDAPKERTKQVAMGAVLVSTAAIAAVSASYALYVALHLWVPFAVLGGLAWGLVILNLDRWLVVSTPRLRTKLGTLAMALPRVLLAILIGAVISTPLMLAVFSSEINAEVKVMAAEKEAAFTTQLQNDSRYKQLPAMQQQIQVLQNDLATGVTDADVMNDPAVVDLQHRLDAVTKKYDDANAAVLCEEDGTCGTRVPGIAAAAEEKVATRDRLATQMQHLQDQLTVLKPQVRQQLESQDAKKSADQRVQLHALQTQVADTQQRRDAEIAAHRQAVGQGDGILARLTALGRIQHGDSSLAMAHLMLFLFMTAIECLPIIFKTMLALGPPSLYERLVALEEEKLEARVRLRMQTEYEEAETMARSALTAAEARAARTLEAESKATGMVLNAQLAVTREGVRRWRDEQLAAAELDELYDGDLDGLDDGLTPAGKRPGHR